mmetsp:Transcript_41121/g.130656  ORF Transcript_41121/g.130656 Transcript_41121/m.130656 type:complete len:325 (+) Transcript_41121:60-1034(+)
METGRAWSLVVDTHAASTPNTTPELIFHGCMLLLVKTIHVRHCLRLNHPAAGMWPSMRPGRGPLCSLAEHLQHRPGQVVRPRRQGWPLLHGRLDAVHLLHDLHLFDCLLLLLLLTCLGSLLRQQLGLLQSNLRLARDVILDVLGVPLVEEILLLAMISHAPLLGLGLLLLLLRMQLLVRLLLLQLALVAHLQLLAQLLLPRLPLGLALLQGILVLHLCLPHLLEVLDPLQELPLVIALKLCRALCLGPLLMGSPIPRVVHVVRGCEQLLALLLHGLAPDSGTHALATEQHLTTALHVSHGALSLRAAGGLVRAPRDLASAPVQV